MITLPADGHKWKEIDTYDACSHGWECDCGASFVVQNEQDGEVIEDYEPGDGHDED